MSSVLDVFCHILPTRFIDAVERCKTSPLPMFARARQIPAIHDLEARFRVMDEFPGYQQILSLASPTLEAICGPQHVCELARLGNDSMAELVAKYPERFPGFVASLPMNHLEGAKAEINRAADELGAVGIQLYTNVNGVPLDTRDHLEVIELIAQRRLPIWLHPIRPMSFPDYAAEALSKLDIWWSFGWPYETSAAMLRLACAGLFDRWPDLIVITHHAGGLTPMMEGRIEFGFDAKLLRNPDDAAMVVTRHHPIVGLRKFYVDTASFGSMIPLEAARSFFGVERMMFASDMPFDPEGGPAFIRSGLQLIKQMNLSDQEYRDIMSATARHLLLRRAVAEI